MNARDDATDTPKWPNRRPSDASTLILIDRTTAVPKVLMGRRHERHAFMPGKFVFPGGRVDPDDARVSVGADLDPRVVARLMRLAQRPSPTKARALAVTAIREAFEETGLMVGRRIETPADLTANGPWRAFAEAGIAPDLSDFYFIARAVTSPRRPRRFDTRFFVVDAQSIAHRVEGVTGPDAELVELVWLPITETHTLDMPPISLAVLAELETRIADGLSHDQPAPYYRSLNRTFFREML